MSVDADVIRAFLHRFFGEENDAWPAMDPAHSARTAIEPFLEDLRMIPERPIILPRRVGGRRILYAKAFTDGQSALLHEALRAFIGPTWSLFPEAPVRVARMDQVEASFDLLGPGDLYELQLTAQTSPAALAAARALRQVLSAIPDRPGDVPQPVGRLLAQFDQALAAGDPDLSRQLLERLASSGAINPVNAEYLRIRRLSAIGDAQAVTRAPSLDDVIASRPPTAVRHAILGAIHAAAVAPAQEAGNIEAAISAVHDWRTRVVMVADGLDVPVPETSAVILALVAADGAAGLLDRRLMEAACEAAAECLPALRTLLEHTLSMSAGLQAQAPPRPQPAIPESSPVPGGNLIPLTRETPSAAEGWLAWLQRIYSGNLSAAEAAARATDLAASGVSMHDIDSELAHGIASVGEESYEVIWRAAPGLVEADDPAQPAGGTSGALLDIGLFLERFGPTDLGVLGALIDSFVRSAPPADRYEQILGDFHKTSHRWVSTGQANRVLDLADSVALAASPHEATRVALIQDVLLRLHSQRHRLRLDSLLVARRLTRDLSLGLSWEDSEAEPEDQGGQPVPDATLFLYSLETHVLARVRDLISELHPQLNIHASAAHVGGPDLRDQVRSSDLLVVATRRAKHAATSFIERHRREGSIISYPEGGGSASMMRAVLDALDDLADARP